jgi:type IV pilus assembly protein PilY1
MPTFLSSLRSRHFTGFCAVLMSLVLASHSWADKADDEKSFIFYKLPLRANASSFSGTTLQKGLLQLLPSYECTRWSGELTTYEANEALSFVGKWKATEFMPAPELRKIKTVSTDKVGAASLIDFTYDSLLSVDLLKWTSESKATDQKDMVNYLRGDRSYEAEKKSTVHAYRNRYAALGDIVGSTPLFVGAALNEQYLLLPTGTPGQSSYSDYLNSKAKRTAAVYVGANDGMLHGFDASTGKELFAYIPSILLNKLSELSQADYAHDFYVNGALTEADVYDKTLNKWRNLLIGTLGAGGNTVFALDVTDPSNVNLLWEMNTQDSKGKAYKWELMGSASKPEVGLMMNGSWAVVLGNGLGNKEKKSELLIVDALTGAKMSNLKLDIEDKYGNGLSGVRLVKDFQQRVVAAYAGDLSGNLWRFDLHAPSSDDWAVGFGGKTPLLTLPANQDITAAPIYMDHPQGGTMVLFGTGKLLEESDPADISTQSLYGVWDKTLLGSASSAANAIKASERDALLVKQSFESTTLGLDSSSYRSSSANPVNWSTQRGWRLDLTLKNGQRSIDPATLLRGFALFHTLVPASIDSKDPCAAQTGGAGYAVLVNALSGARPALQVLVLDGVSSKGSSASVVSAWQTGSTAPASPLFSTDSRVAIGAKSVKLPSLRGIERTWRQLR